MNLRNIISGKYIKALIGFDLVRSFALPSECNNTVSRAQIYASEGVDCDGNSGSTQAHHHAGTEGRHLQDGGEI